MFHGAEDDTQFCSPATRCPDHNALAADKNLSIYSFFPIFVIIFTGPLNWFGSPPPLFMKKKTEIDNRFPGKKGNLPNGKVERLMFVVFG